MISSIGLDGEEMDQITFLPKPRIQVYTNMVVVTAKLCLEHSTAKLQVLDELDMDSPLGKMQVVRVLDEGQVLVGGPSKIHDMDMLIQYFKDKSIDKIFIDGAFSRHSSLRVSEGFIYCVGGGYSTLLENIVSKARTDIARFNLLPIAQPFMVLNTQRVICLIQRDGSIKYLSSSSLLSEFDVFSHIDAVTEGIYLPNALTDEFAKKLLKSKPIALKMVIVDHPTSIQVKDDTFKRLQIHYQLYAIHHTRLLAVCMNPTSPYRQAFDAFEMKLALEKVISYPIINVLEEGETDEQTQTR